MQAQYARQPLRRSTCASVASSPRGVTEGADAFASEVSGLLLKVYRSAGSIEASVLSRQHDTDISLSDSRVIITVGRLAFRTGSRINVSELACACDVTVPSATSSVNRLVTKGLLRKEPDERDGRCVNIMLTRTGEKIYRIHVLFHLNMASRLAEGLSPAEREALLAGIHRLADFYHDVEMERV